MLSDQVLEYWIDLIAAGLLNVFGVWEGHLAYASEISGGRGNVTIRGFCNAPGRNESSNRKRYSLLKLVYTSLKSLKA